MSRPCPPLRIAANSLDRKWALEPLRRHHSVLPASSRQDLCTRKLFLNTTPNNPPPLLPFKPTRSTLLGRNRLLLHPTSLLY